MRPSKSSGHQQLSSHLPDPSRIRLLGRLGFLKVEGGRHVQGNVGTNSERLQSVPEPSTEVPEQTRSISLPLLETGNLAEQSIYSTPLPDGNPVSCVPEVFRCSDSQVNTEQPKKNDACNEQDPRFRELLCTTDAHDSQDSHQLSSDDGIDNGRSIQMNKQLPSGSYQSMESISRWYRLRRPFRCSAWNSYYENCGTTGFISPAVPLSANESSSGTRQSPVEDTVARVTAAGSDVESTTGGLENTGSNFRIKYLKKLSYANVWRPGLVRPPQYQTVSIFDWDDTLLCTSYLNLKRNGRTGAVQGSALLKQLNFIQKHGVDLLSCALRFGRVFVVTNAVEGWVEFSARKYLPGLVELLRGVTVISARERFQSAYPNDCFQWKRNAFLEVRRLLDSCLITNLISAGDSVIEMEALHIMGREFSQALVKTIKLQENPSPEELAKQLEAIARRFEVICLSAKNLRIGLARREIVPKHRKNHTNSESGSGSKLSVSTAEENSKETGEISSIS